MDFWIVQSLNGLSFGMLLFLLASGLSLVFGLMGIVNLTHGSFYLLGAYLAFTLIGRTGSFLVALVVAPPSIAVLGLLIHRFLLRRFPKGELAQVLLTFAVVVAALYLVVHSPFGYTLRGIRESESRMACLGYHVWLHKYLACLIAGGVAGIAGVLFVYYHGFVSPAELSLVTSAEGLLMVIVGGVGTLLGPALGAGVVVFLRNIVSAYTERWLMVLGLIYLLVVLFAPHGVVGAIQARLPSWLYRRVEE